MGYYRKRQRRTRRRRKKGGVGKTNKRNRSTFDRTLRARAGLHAMRLQDTQPARDIIRLTRRAAANRRSRPHWRRLRGNQPGVYARDEGEEMSPAEARRVADRAAADQARIDAQRWREQGEEWRRNEHAGLRHRRQRDRRRVEQYRPYLEAAMAEMARGPQADGS